MSHSSTKGSAATLVQATKELTLAWQETQEHWHDSRSLDFEKQYMEELPFRLNKALSALQELDTLLRKVTTDCE